MASYLPGLATKMYSLVAKLLEAKRGECIELSKLASTLYIPEEDILELVDNLASQTSYSFISYRGGCIIVYDKIELAIAATKIGVPENIVSTKLDWRLFEEYTARVLREAGYRVYRGLKVAGPWGLELDILSLAASHGLAIDCKHWQPRYTSPSRLKLVAQQLHKRINRLEKYWRSLGLPLGTWRILPVIIVLKHYIQPFVEGAVVVPVSRLRGFLYALPELLFHEDIRVKIIKP